MPNFFYHHETHTYRLGDEILPSVTQVLRRAGMIDESFYTGFGKERGNAVHQAIFYDIHDDLHFDSLHETILPYVNAWLSFRKLCDFSPTLELCEKPGFSKLHRYAGTPDLVGYINGQCCIVDVKTGDVSTVHLQTAAYAKLEHLSDRQLARFSLKLKNDGKFSLTEHKNPNDFLRFLKLLY